jgi:hypothetical protein
MAFLPDRPETSKFFTEEERKIALARANRDTSGDVGYHVNKSEVSCSPIPRECVIYYATLGHIADAFKDWRVGLSEM